MITNIMQSRTGISNMVEVKKERVNGITPRICSYIAILAY